MKYLILFLTFAKIGMFTIGGGYAMIPLIEREIVNKKIGRASCRERVCLYV